jgi:hypothetical protein
MAHKLQQGLHHGEAAERSEQDCIELPAPSFWPFVTAAGITMLVAGLVTNVAFLVVGAVVVFSGILGWWHDVIPNEQHEEVPINQALRPSPIMVEERSVVRLRAGEGGHRVRIPEEVHPYSAGVWGGLAGGAAMAAMACLYGLVAQHSIWYPVNLLAGVIMPDMGSATLEQLRAYHGFAFFAALIGHAVISTLVGIVYAVMLPMFPKYAPFWAGILVPVFWSGLVATTLDVLNPAMNARISWPWFVACQLGFGLVGGFVIARSVRIKTMQSWTLAERAFIEAPGLRHRNEGDPK